jgi:hypothetical protein
MASPGVSERNGGTSRKPCSGGLNTLARRDGGG